MVAGEAALRGRALVATMLVSGRLCPRSNGLTSQKAILGSIITDVVSLAAIMMAALSVDRYGSRFLFLFGGCILLLCLVAMTNLWRRAGDQRREAIPRPYAVAVVALVCLFGAGFSVSSGPLKWIILGKVIPLEVRSAGQSMSESISLTLTFVQTQSFIAMLRSFKFGSFAYNAAWVIVMTAFVIVFIPETKWWRRSRRSVVCRQEA